VGKRKRGKAMPNYKLPSIEERLCRLEAEAFVGVDQVARKELKRLIDSLEHQRSYYERLIRLENNVSDLRSVAGREFMNLERRVRELEQGAWVPGR
jgi:hypothetical protein